MFCGKQNDGHEMIENLGNFLWKIQVFMGFLFRLKDVDLR